MIRLFRHYISSAYLILVVLEWLVYIAAIPIAYWLRLGFDEDWNDTLALPLAAFFYACVMLAAAASLGLYQRSIRHNHIALLLRMVMVLCIAALAMAVFFYIFPDIFLGRGILFLTILISAVGVGVVRYLFNLYVDNEAIKQRVLVIGSGNNASKIETYQQSEQHSGFVVIGYLSLPEEQQVIANERLIVSQNALRKIVRNLDIDEIVIAVDDRRLTLPVDDILDCKMEGMPIVDLLTFFEKHGGRILVDQVQPSWLYLSDGFRVDGLAETFKRLTDLLASLVLMVVFIPFMIGIVIAISLESRGKGSILYRQIRVGRDGQPFEIYKFRSMLPDAETGGKAQWAQTDDKRITPLGSFLRKYRLDELPQLFNVVRGEMSLVGPRPERPEFVEQLIQEIPYYDERHRVNPGLTGWAQLNYSYGASVEDALRKHEFDLYYLKNASFFLDLLIMLQTVEVMLWKKGSR